MRVTIPENIKDVTLEQYQKYDALIKREGISELELNKRAISIFTNLPYQSIGKIKQTDYEGLILDIVKALETPAPFEYKYNYDGVEYGFEPNLDAMSHGAYIDLAEYQNNIEDLHKFMAVLYRPITKVDKFGNYKIANYDGTKERAELFKQMPMNIVNGARGFFLTLSKQLRIAIQKSTQAELAKAVKQRTTSRSGVGTQPSTN